MNEKIVVCLPTFNESESIREMIQQIRRTGYNLIVVDGYSSDNTREIAESEGIPVYSRAGRGKGYGVQKAIEIAASLKYEWIIFIDCDLTYKPEDIRTLTQHMDKHDMVVGIRDFARINFSRRLVNIFFTKVVNLLFKGNLQDVHSGLRALRIIKFKDYLDAPGFEIETQISIVALKHKLKIKQVLIAFSERSRSKAGPLAAIPGIILIIKEYLQGVRH